MRTSLVFIFSLTATLSALAADVAPQQVAAPVGLSAQVTFPNYGFTISPLDGGTAEPLSPALQMYLPAAALPSNTNLSFSPNVYVQVIPYLGTMQDYVNEATAKMQADGYIIRAQISLNANEWNLEYIAVLNGLAMHWFAKAVYSDHRVYYAAGGTPDEMWAMYGDKLKSCVNSLQITGTAPQLKVVPLQQPPVTSPPAGATPAPTPAAASATAAAPAAGTAKPAASAPAAKSATGTSTSK
jgi:hypothetical protein